jgi:UDP-2,3-diacylglucosamine hydrolase
MDRSSAVVVSDAHLGAAPRASEEAFLAFLRSVPDRTNDLLINGDLFDFWFEYRTVVLSYHFPVLRVLADLRDAGVRLRLVGGNHDSWGGRFLSEEIGIELLEGPLVTDVGGLRTYVAHGDGLGGGDWGYRALKKVIRSRPARFAFRLVHPDWTAPLIRGVSRTESRHDRPADPECRTRGAHLAEHAVRLLESDTALDLVLFGHSHVPELRETSPGRYYLNTGDWIHHLSWGEVGPEGVRLNRWNRR